MKIISYAWTVPALIARRKVKTRRLWKEKYAKSFHAGDMVQAYDKNPRNGGKRVGIVRLTKDPYQQSTEAMTMQDYEDEGLMYFEEQKLRIQDMTPMDFFLQWKKQAELVWVVEFELITIRPTNTTDC